MNKKRFNLNTELCKHLYQPDSHRFVVEPKNNHGCFTNSKDITIIIDTNSIPIFSNIQHISANQLKFDFRVPASTNTTRSVQINLSESKQGDSINLDALNSSVYVEVGEILENGSQLIYWYLDGSKKIYGHFMASRIFKSDFNNFFFRHVIKFELKERDHYLRIESVL